MIFEKLLRSLHKKIRKSNYEKTKPSLLGYIISILLGISAAFCFAVNISVSDYALWKELTLSAGRPASELHSEPEPELAHLKLYHGVYPGVKEDILFLRIAPNAKKGFEVDRKSLKEYEPKDLKVVGILTTEKTKLALMEDNEGKGFLVTEGMPIGKEWLITKIFDAGIILSTYRGMDIYKTISKSSKD